MPILQDAPHDRAVSSRNKMTHRILVVEDEDVRLALAGPVPQPWPLPACVQEGRHVSRTDEVCPRIALAQCIGQRAGSNSDLEDPRWLASDGRQVLHQPFGQGPGKAVRVLGAPGKARQAPSGDARIGGGRVSGVHRFQPPPTVRQRRVRRSWSEQERHAL